MKQIRKEEQEIKYIKTVETVINITCDWCKKDIQQNNNNYVIDEFKVQNITGYNYGSDGVYKNGWYISDLCDSCKEKLMFLLIQQGITLSTYELEL